MKRSHPVLLVCLVLLLAPTDARPGPWPPIIIDDFQEGLIPLTQGYSFFVQTGLAPQSCIGGERSVQILTDNSGRSLTLFGGDVTLHVIGSAGSFNAATSLQLDYNFPTRDFTQNGGLDRIVFDVESTAGEMSVEVLLSDEADPAATGWVFSGPVRLHSGQIQIPLSRFVGGMDLTRVRQANVRFSVDNAGALAEVKIKRIRVIGSTSIAAQWDVPDEIFVGPPFPLPSPWMAANHFDEQGTQQATEQVSVSLQQALFLPGGGDFPVEIQYSDSGNGGGPGDMAALSVVETTAPVPATSWDPGESSPPRASHSEGAFDLLIGVRPPVGVLSGGLEPMDLPQLPHAKVIYVPFDLRIVDASGSSTGIVANMLRVEIPDGEPYVFADVQLVPPDVDQFGLHFELRDDGTGGVPETSSGPGTRVLANEAKRAPGQPLFNVSLEGDWVPTADASTAVGTRQTNGSLVLSAFPNVMADHTLLRLNRSMANGTRIRIYDLAGREVRSLSLSGGGDSAMWDGRDARGDRVASGVYLARAEDGVGHAVRRLVVVR